MQTFVYSDALSRPTTPNRPSPRLTPMLFTRARKRSKPFFRAGVLVLQIGFAYVLGNASMSASSLKLNFGTVQVGDQKILVETLTNAGPVSVTISKTTLSGSGFSFGGLSLPVTLPAGHGYTFNMAFAPKSGGSRSGSFSVISATGPILTIPLSGNGLAAGGLDSASATSNFGTVTVGSSKSVTTTLSASGASVTISSATSTSSEFTLAGITLPITVPAGQTKSLTIKFAPKASGLASGHISFQSNAANSPTIHALAGSGIATVQHTVTLSWRRSTSKVAGYNVYRSLESGYGPYTKINPVIDTATSYVDDSVQSGKTYYYVTTSVNRGGKVSRYSNKVRAVIPSP